MRQPGLKPLDGSRAADQATQSPPPAPSSGPMTADKVEGALPASGAIRRTRRVYALWMDAYSTFLVLVIVLYYALLLVAGSLLIRLALELTEWHLTPGALLRGFAVALLLGYLLRLGWLLWQGIRGLVTRVHESAFEETPGVLLSLHHFRELYKVVADVAHQVGAPMPDEICVSHEAICYVTEERWFALKTQRRLVLVLGLPHLEVLTQRELETILAHELVHFRCGDTRLGVFVFRFLESLRVVNERAGDRRWHWIDPMYWFSVAYFLLAMRFSAPFRKYQELRADYVSAHIFGGPNAARTLLKEWLLARQFDASVEAFAAQMADRSEKGADNVFRWFISNRWHDFSPAGQDYLLRRLEEVESSSWFDSHPTMKNRVTTMMELPPHPDPEPVPAYRLVYNLTQLENRLHRRWFAT